MANIRPAGVFDTTYKQDIALDRTRLDKFFKRWLGLGLLLLIPLLTARGPFGVSIFAETWIGTINRIAIFVIAVQGLNLLIGYTGQISLGHAAFMGIGAYGSAILARELGMSFWLALPLTALVTGLVGLLFGLPSLRVKGFYLAMATLAAQFIIPWVLRYPMEHLTGGTRPLNVPAPLIGPFGAHNQISQNSTGSDPIEIIINTGDAIMVDILYVNLAYSGGAAPMIELVNADGEVVVGGDINMQLITNDAGVVTGFTYTATKPGDYILTVQPPESETAFSVDITQRRALSFSSDIAIYYIIVPLSVLLMLLARNIIRTRVGRAFISVRDNDLAAELLGINVFRYKLQAFFLSAVYAGIAGTLLAFESNSLSLDSFRLDTSVLMLAMLIIGGAGFPLGALFGVGFVRILTDSVIPSVSPVLRDNLPGLLPFIGEVNIDAAVSPLLFGTALVLFLVIEPRGIAHRWEVLKAAWKIRPYSH